MDSQPAAPPVVAVVITCDPGEWLEVCLTALSGQDYPELSVLVVDAASAEDPTARVAAVLPSAYVRRCDERTGFAAAANQVLGVVEGASHYLFCHDDVAPAPDAVRLLVEEAFRSNAGVISPKFVQWDAPDRLLAVGASADKGGVVVGAVERGELDQEQHDAVRDVFVAPAGCMLVRADLFATLAGFDPGVGVAGEELDLSWRAQIAGARVIVAPAAVVRHLEATTVGRRGLDGTLTTGPEGEPEADELALRRGAANVRSVLKNYGLVHLVRVLPQLWLASLLEAGAAVATGHFTRAQRVFRPWREGGRNPRALFRLHRLVQRVRALPDHEVRDLQARGNVRLQHLLRPGRRADGSRSPVGIDLEASWRAGWRLSLPVGLVVGAIVVFGSRYVIGSRLPTFGEVAPIPRPATLVHLTLSGWRTTGMGGPSPAPTAFAVLAGAGAVVLGHMAFLQRLLVLGMVPLGALGASRIGRHLGSPRSRLVTSVLYVANPVPYNAWAQGHWSGLIAYGAVPWILLLLARATGRAPFDEPEATLTHRCLRLGAVLALAGAFVPSLIGLAVAVGVLLAVCSVVVAPIRAGLRAARAAAGAALVAAVLLFPWAIGLLPPGWEAASVIGVAPAPGHAAALSHLLRFQTGPIGAGPLGWALLVTAALPLILGDGWRWEWAARMWALALGAWALVWAGSRGWISFPLPPAEVTLSLGAVALATCAGLGMAAFEIDLREYHFGWRQLASTIAAAAAVVAVLPVVGAVADGRWHAPATGVDAVLSWIPDKQADGDFRVLWIGDPSVMPVVGWPLGRGVEYATTRNGLPDVTSAWPGTAHGATQVFRQEVGLARAGQTTQLGHLLAPTAVRYLVVVQRSAPSSATGTTRPPPDDVLQGLAAQTDLRRVDSDPAYVVYENAAWAPARSLLPPSAAAASAGNDPSAARSLDLTGATPVLSAQTGPTTFRGQVPPGTVLLSEAPSPRWHLSVAGTDAPRSDAFGVANAFSVTQGGQAQLSYHTSVLRVLALILQLALWVLLLGRMWVLRRRRRKASATVALADASPIVELVGVAR